jgi:hypothetical protein
MLKQTPVAMLVMLAVAWIDSGCASAEKQVQRAAKDWCMTIRGSQIIPVYPLTEDIQPGDVFLVQVPICRQQQIYDERGFLALDNLIARINPDGYDNFYSHSFLNPGSTNILPRDWVRPNGTGLYSGTNGISTRSWAAAPRAAFPSYSFSVQNGSGLSLAVPVSGVPVGLSLLASDSASGTIQIEDARTLGVDTISLYEQLKSWAAANTVFLQNYGASAGQKRTNYVRVVTRVYATGKMMVSLKDASNRSGGLDAGVPKPVNLLTPELHATATNTPESALKNYTNAWSVLADMVKGASALTNAAGQVLPGGSLRLAAASARTVSLDETFDPPIIFGYLGFDCAINPDGSLSSPIPTQALLDANLVNEFSKFKTVFTNETDSFDIIETAYLAAKPDQRTQIRDRALQLGLIQQPVEDAQFVKYLRRGVDANDPVIAQKLKALAEFSSQIH